jgi:hypothetical protein
MFARAKAFANRHSRLAILRRNFNNWKSGPNAQNWANHIYMGKPFGRPIINSFNAKLRAALNAGNHSQANRLEREYKNLRNSASRHVRNQARLTPSQRANLNRRQNALYSPNQS